MIDQIALLEQERWNVNNAIGLIIDCGLSYRQVDRIRAALSLTYDADLDRFYHPIWLEMAGEYVRIPEPIPSRTSWSQALRELKGELKISLHDDGTVAALRLSQVVREMISDFKQHGMLQPGAGDSAGNPVQVVFMFDGFPVERISIEHFCMLINSLIQNDYSINTT